jgi:hypothetical protein
MAFFYVKNGGTATGDGGRATTARTGTWNATASEYYDNIEDALGATTDPRDGDQILISDLAASSWSPAGDVVINGSTSSAADGAGLQVVSVDNANQDQYKPGASQEITHASRQYTFNFNGLIAGVTLISADHIGSDTACKCWRFIDASLTPGDGGKDIIIGVAGGAHWLLENTDIDMTQDQTGVAGSILIGNGGRLVMYGGSIPYHASASSHNLFGPGYADGGASADLYGVDLSTVETNLINGLTSAASHDCVNVRLFNCKLNSGITFFSAQPVTSRHRLEIFNTDDDTSADYHRFHIEDGSGSAKNNDVTFVTATEAWYESADKSSIEVVTSATCSHVEPFIFDLPAQYIDLSDTASDVLTLDLVTDLTLTDTEIAAFIQYADGTTIVQSNGLTTGKTVGTGNLGIDPLAAGSTLAASALGAGDWTAEPASPNFYKLELDTTSDAGQACVVSVRIAVFRASIAAGKLFIHPLITAS